MRTVTMTREHHALWVLPEYDLGSAVITLPGCFVYYLWLGPVLQYVGKASDLGGRMRQHKRDKLFDRVTYRVMADKWQMHTYERAEIARLGPPLNKHRCQGWTRPPRHYE